MNDMDPVEGRFTGIGGGAIAYQAWLPESAAVAAVLVVHGLGEHAGRYQNLIARLLPLGYAVYGFDLPGHGHSEGVRGFVARFDDYTAALDHLSHKIHEWHPALPCFLFGHSMGGLVVARHLLDAPPRIRGAMLSSPCLGVRRRHLPLLRLSLRLLSRLVPRARVLAIDPAGLSRDPQVVADYRTDPLVFHGLSTARLAAELLRTIDSVLEKAGEIRLPLLVLQGDADRIVDPSGAQRFHERVGASDKTLLWFDGFCHELLNEPGHTDVLDAVERWLAAHLPS
jgi:acylglycerol lipase